MSEPLYNSGPDLTAVIHQYTARDWHVFPVWPLTEDGRCVCGTPDCENPGKHPLGKLVPKGLADATVDAATITQWWSTWPDANIAIRTGAMSGIVVLDVDPSNGGWDSAERLEGEHGEFPSTPTVATGGGGAHLYFRHPGTLTPNSAGRIAPGIDVRGDGGYVIAPPSGHVSGKPYQWAEGFSPDDVPLAEAPAWMFAAPRRESPRLQEDETIVEGARNTRLMRLGAAFRRYGMTGTEIAAALHTINTARCQPPLERDEVERIAESVTRYEPASSGGSLIKRGRKVTPRFTITDGKVVAS